MLSGVAVPARLAHVDLGALAWAYEVAEGDWRRVVARGEGIAVAATPQVHRIELPAARPKPAPPPRRAPPPQAITGPRQVGGWTFVVHALRRMARRGISESDALAIIAAPEVDLPAPPHRDLATGAERLAHRGRVRVVYDPSTACVITVYLRGEYDG